MEIQNISALRWFLTAAMLFAFSFELGCTNKSESGKVQITLPVSLASSKTAATSQSVSASADSGGTSFNSNINPLSVSDVNCFAIFISGADLADNSCTVGTSAALASTIKFGPNVGFVPAGSTISLDASVGQRTIYVIGLRAAKTSACSSYAGKAPDSLNLSEPFILAAQATTIHGGANTVAISAALDTSKKIIDCKFVNSGPGGGGSNIKPFGDARDANLTANASGSPMIAGTSAMNSIATRSGLGTVPDSKIFAASRRISAIATAGDTAGQLLTTGSTFSSTEFSAGDEVVWYVAGGASSLGSPDDPVLGACGGGLYLGRYGTAHVASVVSSNQLLLDQSISGAPGVIRSVSLNNPPTNANYCTILISRVSSFDNITVPTSYNLTMQAEPFSYVNGTGGILMVRVNTINVAAGSTFKIDGTGTGYSGGTSNGSSIYQGDGLTSAGTTAVGPNYNGGMPGTISSLGGSGGGNGGSGGNGGGTGGMGGSVLTSCGSGTFCYPLIDRKAFMGAGAGGAGSSATGGNGGGVVLVHARNITGAGTFTLISHGSPGGSGSAGSGGGAGGTTGLFTLNAPISTLSMGSNGGNGGSAPSGGGGGGAGILNLHRCTANFTAGLTTSVAGGTPGTAGTAGGSGSPKIVDDSAICSISN